MRRLATRTLYLAALFSLFIGVSRSYGSQQHAPPSFDWLHLTDCQLPCWGGIEIGKTTRDAAIQGIKEAFPDYDVQVGTGLGRGQFLSDGTVLSYMEQSISLQKRDDPTQKFAIKLLIQNASQIVQELIFLTEDKSLLPTIPELSAMFGAPFCVIQNQGRGNTPLLAVFQYHSTSDDIQISARLLSRGNGWNQRIYELRLSVTIIPQGLCKQWSGFTNLSRYLPR